MFSLFALGFTAVIVVLYFFKRYQETKRKAAEDRRIYSYVFIPLLTVGAAALWLVLFRASAFHSKPAAPAAPATPAAPAAPAVAVANDQSEGVAPSAGQGVLGMMFGGPGAHVHKKKEGEEGPEPDRVSAGDGKVRKKILWWLICAVCLLLVYLKRMQ